MDNTNITIAGRTYELVERHRPKDDTDSRVYKGSDSFLRIGPAAKIETNLNAHKRLEVAGFPVPRVLHAGNIGKESYFVEEFFGEKTYRITFAEEVKDSGQISEASFNGFMQIMQRYLTAQATSATEPDTAGFLERTHVDGLCAELPEYAEKIKTEAARCLETLSKFPFVLSHGDLSANNLFPRGVIDLEDALTAPFGYDATSVLMTTDWYPADIDFEFVVTPYHFTDAQRSEYLAMCNMVSKEANIPSVSAYLDEFAFFRAAWLTEGMAQWPKTQKYRHKRFISEYLSS